MRVLLTILLLASAGPAQAMNWEGHDDWMADMAPALVYEQEAPHAVLRVAPGARCGDREASSAANPYEQIPLERHDCATPETKPEAER